MPKDVKPPFIRECELYGADVTLVDGLITDAGRIAAETRQAARLVRRLDAQGAVPHRRQEDDGLRARRAARVGRCPTGSSTRPAAAPAWSGCGRRSRRCERIGWIDPARRPQMVSVQAERLRADRPRVRQRRRARRAVGGRATPSPTACACRKRDRRLPGAARGARERRHGARGQRRGHGRGHARARPPRGRSAPRPKAARRFSALKQLLRDGVVKPTDSVVLFNTGGALKYLDVLGLVRDVAIPYPQLAVLHSWIVCRPSPRSGTAVQIGGRLAQLGERRVRNAEVASSILAPSTNTFRKVSLVRTAADAALPRRRHASPVWLCRADFALCRSR